MSTSSISKIHVTNSTRLSLNDRFTAFASKPQEKIVNRRRSRSRSISRKYNGDGRVDSQTSMANRRLLQQLARRHKMHAALKLKRRSMRTAGGNGYATMKRGSVKALRVAANGKPIKANTLSNVATMKADFITNRARPLRRSSSNSNISGRLGARRPSVGGAAERVAKRQSQQLRGRTPVRNRRSAPVASLARVRSRSRSRTRLTPIENANNITQRGRSLSRGRGGRSRSRSRGGIRTGGRSLPIKARLGLRPGLNNENDRQRGRGRGRTASTTRRGVATGRVQKRRISTAQVGDNANNLQRTGGTGARGGRAGGRSASRNGVGRSRSRTRRAFTGQQQEQLQRTSGTIGRGRRRGQSQQRNIRGGGARVGQRNGKTNGQQTQLRRGRSRSRGGRGGRNLGRNDRPLVNKDDLDKELDQYMATTKTENNMDYLLKN